MALALTCSLCDVAASLADARSVVYVCDCGRTHIPGGFHIEVRARRVGATARPGRDVRAHEHPDAIPAPTPRERRDPYEVALAGLLAELRPDRSGPYGWGAYDAPPTERPTPASVDRVQESVEVPSIPRGLRLLSTSSAGERLASDLGAAVDVALASVRTSTDPDGAFRLLRGLRLLLWLQREGTLHAGLDALLRAVAGETGTPAQQQAWQAGAGAARGALVHARAEIATAAAVWCAWSEWRVS